MKVLVTGGTGFIGKALVKRLLDDEYQVAILTRDEKKKNSGLDGKVEFIKADISDPLFLENLSAFPKKFDTIVHLAACLDYYGDWKRIHEVNVRGTTNLLRLAQRSFVKKFIYISSIEAIGTVETKEISANEETAPRPVSSYGKSKLEAEKQVLTFGEKGLNSVVLRLGNVYGPGSEAFIVPVLNAIIKRDLLLKYLPVYKSHCLHFIYIDDAVNGIIKAVQSDKKGEIYILAGEEYTTIGALFEMIAESLNVDNNLLIRKERKMDKLYLILQKNILRSLKRANLVTYFIAGHRKRIHRAYSIEKAKKDLGYSPQVNLREGIARTLEWARKEGLLNL